MNKETTIFIDTQDMEERYGEQLYQDYLKEQLDLYKSVLNEVREFVYKSKVIVPMEYAINVGLFKKKIVEILDKVGGSDE